MYNFEVILFEAILLTECDLATYWTAFFSIYLCLQQTGLTDLTVFCRFPDNASRTLHVYDHGCPSSSLGLNHYKIYTFCSLDLDSCSTGGTLDPYIDGKAGIRRKKTSSLYTEMKWIKSILDISGSVKLCNVGYFR